MTGFLLKIIVDIGFWEEEDTFMTRMRRIKVNGEDAYYHIVSRTVHQRFLMGDGEMYVTGLFLKFWRV